MRLLVLSDSHGHDEQLANIILEHRDADAVIFLGDGERDLDSVVDGGFVRGDQTLCRVRGNCDLASREPEMAVREFGGVRFLITHGHRQNVKYGLWGLVDEARKQNCAVALYGHTHLRSCRVKDGVTLINPGSAGEGSYCVVDITNGVVSVVNA